jgi:hypothetical protein
VKPWKALWISKPGIEGWGSRRIRFVMQNALLPKMEKYNISMMANIKYIILKTILLLYLLTIMSCVNKNEYIYIENNNLIKDIGYAIVFINYSKNEISVFDIETSKIRNTISLPMDIYRYGGFKFCYANDRIYIMHTEKTGVDNGNTKVFMVDEHFENLINIYNGTIYYSNFSVIDDNIYFVHYIEPYYEANNIEKNYIIKYNLLTRISEKINYNNYISPNIYVNHIIVLQNEQVIIMKGWVEDVTCSNLYLYKLDSNVIEILDNNIGINRPSMAENVILYGRTIFSLPDRERNTIAYQINNSYNENYILTNKLMILTMKHPNKKQDFLDKIWLGPRSYRAKDMDYYVAEINGRKIQLFYNTTDVLEIIGKIKKQ